ncbi:DUF3168 domain-containing protein [Nonomuraea phyllanthi]|uniref:DUF3168 domain-containing protein n=1 Tax=Nonomuraea phyllanthi TaxID=2219224 RepID=A0A5C4V787_9ACTN|nr:DUF3168 domain-containing protein [Nonomuraea phyllanthi]KAB8186865.1 DUF3168 domain-containing protein [Nonomuraea phyllanthi]
MTPLPSRPLVDALLASWRAAVPDTLKIHDAQASPDAEPPYAVAYFDTGMKSGFHRDLTNDGPNELRYQITSVGATRDQAAWVADKMAAAVLGTVATVSGRRVWPAIEEGSQPVRREDDGTALFFATAQYLTRSDPT